MASSQEHTPPPAHPASTVILLRPSQTGFEVLLLLRAKAIKFAGGAWVFPGGRIDDNDGIAASTDKLDSLEAAKVAAARESEEEAGLSLDPCNFVYFSHWTTPLAEKKRFSTWFLLGDVSANSAITVDDGEIVEYKWLTPNAAIELHKDGQLNILPPTYLTLLELSTFTSIEDARQRVEERNAPQYFPNMVFHDNTVSVLYNEDAGYDSGDINSPGRKHRMTMKDGSWDYIQQ